MKRLKRIMALVIAMVMVLGCMSMSAFAESKTATTLTVVVTVTSPVKEGVTVNNQTVNIGADGTGTENLSLTDIGYDDADNSVLAANVKNAITATLDGYTPFINADGQITGSGGTQSTTATVTFKKNADEGEGSITIKSPVMDARYNAYRIFDMTMANIDANRKTYTDELTNFVEDSSSYAYSIDTNSPFFNAVKTFADTTANGLILTEVTPRTNGDYKFYNVTVGTTSDTADDGYGEFDPQKFGQSMQTAIESDTNNSFFSWTYSPKYEDNKNTITVATSDEVTFEKLPLGYYLILYGYPEVGNPTATLTIPAYDENQTQHHDAQTVTFDKNSTDEQFNEAAEKYAKATVTDAYVTQYIADNKLKENKELKGGTWTDADIANVKDQLLDSFKESALEQTKSVIENKLAGEESDINVQAQRLVFVDSTTPHVNINEKNELTKWDVPVNPEGSATIEGLPEHGEPDGGKNIIVGYKKKTVNGQEVDDTTKPIYADSSEANVGDKVKYQLRINAMNFVREDSVDPANSKPDDNDEFSVKQVKEYVIADYNANAMVFDPTDKLMVKVVDKDGNIVKIDNVNQEWDYTAWAKYFFINKTNVTVPNGATVPSSILANGGGLVVPWVKITNDKNIAQQHPYTVNQSYEYETDEQGNIKLDSGGNKIPKKDPQGNPIKKNVYVYSIYDSDVTIVVDYTMTLTDQAIIDGTGNINYAQYGTNYVKPSDEEYNPDKPEAPGNDKPGKPDKEKEVDDATIYTYALAIQKTDQNNNNLPGATFAIKGLTVTKIADGYYKVKSYDSTSADYSDELTCDKDGLLVVEGLMTSSKLTVKEVQAPDGYNVLKGTVEMQAKKVSETNAVVTKSTESYVDDSKEATGTKETTTSEIIYKDKDGTVKCREVTTVSVLKEVNNNGTITYEKGEPEKHYYGSGDTEITVTAFEDLKNAITKTLADSDVETIQAVTTAQEKIINKPGTVLPSTGGIGTTIFYVVGAILVIGAGVILITRRRMDS